MVKALAVRFTGERGVAKFTALWATQKCGGRTGGVDFAIGKFLRNGARPGVGPDGARKADGGKERGGIMAQGRGVGQGWPSRQIALKNGNMNYINNSIIYIIIEGNPHSLGHSANSPQKPEMNLRDAIRQYFALGQF